MPEAFVSTLAVSREVSKRFRARKLRRLAWRLHTSNLVDPPEEIVRRNLWNIAAGYFPGALIADRTALENAPAAEGSVCLVAPSGLSIALPGIVLRPRRGPGPQPSDRPFLDGLYLSSTARAWLDNLKVSRSRNGRLPRTLPRRDLEDRLDALLRIGGIEAANRLRDEARAIAPAIGREREARALDALIGTILGSRDAGQPGLRSPRARARRRGTPYDPARLALFHALHAELRDTPPSFRPAAERTVQSWRTLAFYDAYFSNFIEGTEFTLADAEKIVFEGHIPATRPADAHDILGVWRIASNEAEMRRTANTAAEFLDLLRERHATALASRPDAHPGEFKRNANQAGTTLFVLPEDVRGTLERGFAIGQSLETAFQRAVFMLFLIGEVHPFADGNGRIARIMMNAELVAAAEERIVVPTVYRGNYLAAQRAMTHGGEPAPLIRMLAYIQRWTAAVPWLSIQRTATVLTRCNAFLESEVAEEEGRRLRLP